MDKLLSPVGFYDFFSHFVPGLVFITATGLLLDYVPSNGETFELGIVIVFTFILSYVTGRILKVIFECIMEFKTPRRLFYGVDESDREAVKSRIFRKVNLENTIVDVKNNEYFVKEYDYDDDANKPYEKRIIIEQAATILKQEKIEGDYIMFSHVKYFYQLMSISCFFIFLIYIIINVSAEGFFTWSQFYNTVIMQIPLYVLVIFCCILAIISIIYKLFKCSIFKLINRLIIPCITIFIILALLLLDTLCIKQKVLLFSLPCSILFWEMFIFTYKVYLGDVIKNYLIYKSCR